MNTKSWFSGLKTQVTQFTKISKELLTESLSQEEGSANLNLIVYCIYYLTYVSIFCSLFIYLFTWDELLRMMMLLMVIVRYLLSLMQSHIYIFISFASYYFICFLVCITSYVYHIERVISQLELSSRVLVFYRFY